MLFDGIYHDVCFFHGAAKRFFAVDALNAILGGEDGNVSVWTGTRGETDDVGFLLFDHLLVICVGAFGSVAFSDGFRLFLEDIGDSDEVGSFTCDCCGGV